MDLRAFVSRWHERFEIWTLAAMVGFAMAVWAFIEVADEVVEGESHATDSRVLLALRNADDLSDPIGPLWVEELGRDFTALGGVGVLTLLTISVAGYLWLVRKVRAMLLVLGAIGSGLLASTLLKQAFDRTRPDLVPHDSLVYTASFPSGHSMMAAITYLTLAALLARVQSERSTKVYFLVLAVIITVAVGASRVYLGVHWPSDVLAGWAVGASWALLFWLLARWLQERGQVEKE
ncbi:phosphatase PAP2 family protein [Aurantiacibacter poecillastricola]|uniref:phosphatase PAP2 family protein n=1 Tax=Aurantiacibacter poecillastricola TaxID=3064385 RepID=UPI00273DA892|nr:phosphatase PAP2 family protein [Aurantiacibacter sp. 219JJ12-13]MDP5262870.1 phosphatase PAP2 family protein [Aurantiacibacter sp. 219JJ12-13]